jgi:YidC/Oxa1 family membrane protein insertase
MEKRVVLAIVLCIAVMALWAKFGPQAPPPPAPASAPAGAPPSPAPVAAQPAAPSGTSATPERPEADVDVHTTDVNYVFSSLGGTLKHARLTDPRFFDRPGDPQSGHDLVTTSETSQAAFRTTFPSASFPEVGSSWEVSRPAPDVVSFSYENADVRVEKRYTTGKARYALHLDVVIQNKTDRSQNHTLVLALAGRQDPNKKGGSFFSGGAANLASVLCSLGDKPERTPVEKLAKDPIEKTGNVLWVGTDEKFFLLAAAPYPEDASRQRTCRGAPIDGNVGEASLRFTERVLGARASTTYAFDLFAGPKIISDLEAVQPGGVEVGLEGAVDVARGPAGIFGLLSRPILFLLKFFHGFVHNWGVAIILLTLFIKLLTFYPTQRSLLSAKKMQKLAPKMNAIRKKYENDRQRQSVETMNLYKAHGVSPFGGCLPSLIQMPIWIALYSTLNYAVELYRAPFIFHIHDLTEKDPYYITPLLMGGVMFLQMRMSPASPDNQQQQTMQVMMPIMFTAFSLVLPSGLALYMLTSYLIGIIQQLYVNHLDRKGAPA